MVSKDVDRKKVIDAPEDKERYARSIEAKMEKMQGDLDPLFDKLAKLKSQSINVASLEEDLGKVEFFLKKLDSSDISSFDAGELGRIAEKMGELHEIIEEIKLRIAKEEAGNSADKKFPEQVFENMRTEVEDMLRLLDSKAGNKKNLAARLRKIIEDLRKRHSPLTIKKGKALFNRLTLELKSIKEEIAALPDKDKEKEKNKDLYNAAESSLGDLVTRLEDFNNEHAVGEDISTKLTEDTVSVQAALDSMDEALRNGDNKKFVDSLSSFNVQKEALNNYLDQLVGIAIEPDAEIEVENTAEDKEAKKFKLKEAKTAYTQFITKVESLKESLSLSDDEVETISSYIDNLYRILNTLRKAIKGKDAEFEKIFENFSNKGTEYFEKINQLLGPERLAQAERIALHQKAQEKWEVLEKLVLGDASVEKTKEQWVYAKAIRDALRTAKKTTNLSEYNTAMTDFAENFQALLSSVDQKIKLAYESKMEGETDMGRGIEPENSIGLLSAGAEEKKITTPVVDDEQKKKKEIQERRNKVDTHKLMFNRFLIETAGKQMGLQDEIDSIEKSLGEALKHAHDETEFEKHITAYNDKLSQLVQKIDQVEHGRAIAGNVLQPVSGEIMVPDRAQPVITNNQQPASSQQNHSVPAAPAKKSFWARAKEKIFGSKEKVIAGVKSVKDTAVTAFTTEQGREALKKMTYDTVTTLFGVKIVTDAVKWYRNGEGDLHDWWKGRKETGKLRGEILELYQGLLDSSAKTKNGEALTGAETVEKRLEELLAKVDAANIPDAQKKEIKDRLWAISIKHQEGTEKAAQAREKEVKKLLDAYIKSKISGIKIAKDALNFGLTATGLSLLRGLAYGGASLAELIQKAKKDFAKETVGSIAEKAKKDFGAKGIKNALVQSAIETARSLAFQGAKKDAGTLAKATDFAKAVGVVARAFGIAHLSFNGRESAEEQINKLLTAFQKPEGALDTTLNVGKMMSSNLVDNTLRAAQMVDPTGQVDKLRNKFNSFVADEEEGRSLEQILADRTSTPVAEQPTSPSSDRIMPEASLDPIERFAAEQDLTEESYNYLKQFSSLENNPDSLKRIIESGHLGVDNRSHFTGSKIDNLIEAGGERRAVIFEELLKADKAAGTDLSNGSAIAFLKSQDFSSRHLGYIEQFDGKKGKFDYEGFVKNYNPEDKKMSYALFRAMQGKENTELANAGFVREATVDRAGRTVRVKGDIVYLGLDESGNPILSGDGKVLLKETLLKLEDVSPPARFASAAAANENLTTDDRLWANANAIRSANPNAEMFAGDTANNYEGAENPKELAGIVEAELDKASFARMGEQHIDVLDRAQRGEPIGLNSAAEQHEALHADFPTGKQVELLDTKIQNATVVSGKTIAEYGSSGNMVEASVAAVNTNVPVETGKSVGVATFSEMNEGKDLTPSDSLKEVSANLDYLKQNYEDFRNRIYAEMAYKFIYDYADEQTEQLLRDQVRELVYNPYDNIKNPSNLSAVDRQNIARLSNIVKGFEDPSSNPNWWKEIKGDELRLAFTPYDNNLGIMANGSHAFKIMDGSKEIFFGSQKGHTFTMEKGAFNYSLVERDENGNRVGLYNHRRALEMVRKTSTGLMESSVEEELKKVG